jgi:chromosomal replication initiator protein
MINDYKQVWQNCLKVINDNINYQSYKTWFEPIEAINLNDNILTIQVPSLFFYDWLETKYIDLLKATIKKELGPTGRLEYSIIMDSSYNNSNPYTIKLPTLNKKATKNQYISAPININKNESKSIPNPFIIPGLKKINIQSQLVESKSFENFVEGDCNRLARSAGYAVANNPGKTSFNPLFIYSNVGLGKTHLAHAIGLKVKENFPDKTVLYVSAEQFTTQFIDSIKNNNKNDFVHFYNIIDVLIIDDIQFLSGKEKTQDVFFYIFNQLHQNGKQLVITSDRVPVEMKGINSRLLSRFKWGLAADLQMPDLETRIAIIENKLYNDGVEMPKDVIEYLASSITTNIREIEGSIISILAQSSLNKKDIDLELAKQIIDQFIKTNKKKISIDYIKKIVCDYFDIPIERINSKTHKRDIVQARQLAMYFSKKLTKLPLSIIGLQCGNKSHATVLHACRIVNDLVETDKKFRKYVKELETKINI